MKTLYLYKNEKGYLAFQNKEIFHTDKIHLAYISGIKNNHLANEYTIETLSIEDFQKIYAPIVSEILVIGDLLIHKYKDYNENFPTIPGDHKLIRNSVRNAIQKMGSFHKQIDEILKDEKAKTDDFYESQGNLDALVSNIAEMLRTQNLEKVNNFFEAYKKDSKSLDGIINKILR